MNKEETLARWAEGKDAWNAWAKEMLAERAKMKEVGTWEMKLDESGTETPGNAATSAWSERAIAEFSANVFPNAVDFASIIFPGRANFRATRFELSAMFNDVVFCEYANFNECEFCQYAGFYGAKFDGDAGFDQSCFTGNAAFVEAAFKGHVRFERATFHGEAWFLSSMFRKSVCFNRAIFKGFADFFGSLFSGAAGFVQCQFIGYADFARSFFSQDVRFDATRGESGFNLDGARFLEIPDFGQAHFAEAPRLDNVRVRRGKGGDDLAARYRALKRLAIDGHDHAREQEYFAGELTALRGHPDRLYPNPRNWLRRDEDGRRLPAWPGGARYWFGVFYQILSDFGRSMLRPLGWWALALAGFAFGYLDRHFDRAAEVCRGYAGGAGGWLWASMAQPLVDRFPQLAHLLPLPAAAASPACLVGAGEPWKAALGLSIRKALPFAGVGSTEKLNQIYACLYGIHGETAPAGDLPARFTPVIPDGVDYLGIGQLLLSLLLLFLFLLAVRSHFRIR